MSIIGSAVPPPLPPPLRASGKGSGAASTTSTDEAAAQAADTDAVKAKAELAPDKQVKAVAAALRTEPQTAKASQAAILKAAARATDASPSGRLDTTI